ncbi:MAG: Holliday junction branch migration protein RuvA [Eubacteriales bacterium]|nr:Holliday junction branch migration protein RuvA [Eubacteriales bacterium]
MIAFIRGSLVEIREQSVVLENGGIGYAVFVTGRDAGRIGRTGDEVMLHTYLHVKEDAMQLFGFLSRDDLEVFKLLLNVSGVGPKGALGILSALPANDLRFAVLADDAKTIATAPGIGKKTAQKLILELKDKFHLQDAFEQKLAASVTPAEEASSDYQSEAVQALMALGYSGSDALRAVKAVALKDDMSVEDILKAALKTIR